MNRTEKFLADAQRIRKHYRAEHPKYDGLKVAQETASLFQRTNPDVKELARSFADYWLNEYVSRSTGMDDEPTEQNLAKLAAMQAVLDSEDGGDEGTEALDSKDWQELCSLTNYEAEDLPLETLNNLMILFVDKGGC